MNIKMRLLPANFTYSREFHVRYSTLCKTIQRTSHFYRELAKVRLNIKSHGIKAVMEAVEGGAGVLSDPAREYFDRMKKELPKVGMELQARTLSYLLSLKSS